MLPYPCKAWVLDGIPWNSKIHPRIGLKEAYYRIPSRILGCGKKSVVVFLKSKPLNMVQFPHHNLTVHSLSSMIYHSTFSALGCYQPCWMVNQNRSHHYFISSYCVKIRASIAVKLCLPNMSSIFAKRQKRESTSSQLRRVR